MSADGSLPRSYAQYTLTYDFRLPFYIQSRGLPLPTKLMHQLWKPQITSHNMFTITLRETTLSAQSIQPLLR